MQRNRFERAIAPHVGEGLRSFPVETMQVHLGLRCNQQCRHCHVGASPERAEQMEWAVMERVIDVAVGLGCKRFDLTGGAPELNRHILAFITAARKASLEVQLRTNLTVHLEPGMEAMAAWFRELGVSLVASLPGCRQADIDAQGGDPTYRKSIAVLRKLNQLGYGVEADAELSLVVAPAGAALPSPRAALEEPWRRELADRHRIRFTRLLSIANMPIGGFLADLQRIGQDTGYRRRLETAFDPATLDTVICRRQVCVGHDGRLYDCDFNLAEEIPLGHGAPDRLEDVDVDTLSGRRIVTGEHCFGCTVGGEEPSIGGATNEDS